MQIPLRYTLALVFVLPLLLLSGCFCGQFFRGSEDVASITISPANTSIQPGTTQQFSANGTFGTGGTGDVTSLTKWASSNPAIATIDPTGTAKGITYGTVTISGTCQCSTAQTSLSVGNQAVAISSIAVRPQNPTIAAGLTQQFVATATYSNGTISVITGSAQWTSSDNTIATVSNTGLATGVASGNATITAISATVSGSTTLTVQ
jgi:uncharacterized protein YjdB